MFRFVPRFAVVLLLVMAGTLAPATAGERPFNASGAGVIDIASNSLFAIGFEATHLGKANFYGNFYPSLDNSQPIFVPAFFYAANGDALFAIGTADFDVDTGIAIGTLTFTGGTGRFQDANGSADMMIDFDEDFSSFFFLIDGSIDY